MDTFTTSVWEGQIGQDIFKQVDRSPQAQLENGLNRDRSRGEDPYGAIIGHLETDRDLEKFHYLGELYSCSHEAFVDAVNAGAIEPEAQAAPAAQAAPSEPVAAKSKLQWERLDAEVALQRAKVPGGWLVALAGASVTFYPDAEHRWDGSSVWTT